MTARQVDRDRLAGSPWSADQLLRAVGLAGVGLVMCVVAWGVASGKACLGDQVGWVSVGVGGLVVAFFGQAAWLLNGRRSLGERSMHLLGRPPTRAAARVGVRSLSQQLVGGEGLRWYHRADCPLARGQGWPVSSLAVQEAAGREPCGVCRP
jgi:hypothetical protein